MPPKRRREADGKSIHFRARQASKTNTDTQNKPGDIQPVEKEVNSEFDALPAVRCEGKLGAVGAIITSKPCDFLCGRSYSNTENDPVSGVPPCRWGYPNGVGGGCFYCVSEFNKETDGATREQFISKLGKDATKLQQWRARGEANIEKALSKRNNPSAYMLNKRRNGVKSVAVRNQEYQDTALAPPDDDFYPMKR